jgi:hypothetical protein
MPGWRAATGAQMAHDMELVEQNRRLRRMRIRRWCRASDRYRAGSMQVRILSRR